MCFFQLQGKSETKLRYNDYFNEATKNNVIMRGGKIESLGESNIDGMTNCDFILPSSFKVERIKECKYNANCGNLGHLKKHFLDIAL